MADLELIREAINFAMYELCGGYLDMPSGCDGCPLCDLDNLDDDGNVDCRGILRMVQRLSRTEMANSRHD